MSNRLLLKQKHRTGGAELDGCCCHQLQSLELQLGDKRVFLVSVCMVVVVY